MSVYFVVQEEVHDPDGLNAYMEAAKASSLGRGKAVVVDNAVAAVEGDWHGTRLVILEFEDEDDLESTPENQPVQEEDPYAWAKQRTVVQEQNAAVQQSDTNQPVVQADAHPGWRWDETIQQWVPDPSTMPKQ